MLFYFYNEQLEGSMNFEKVEELILERFQAYGPFTHLQYDTEDFNYCDSVAHLFMSIVAVDFPLVKESFVKGERKIFKEKLKRLSCLEVKKELIRALRYTNGLTQSEECKKIKPKHCNQLKLVINILQTILSKSSHVFKKSHSKNCKKLKMITPFTYPLELIAKREVEVRNGKASIYCGYWDRILELVFDFLLQVELTLIKKCDKLQKVIYKSEDDRIRQIIQRCTYLLNGEEFKKKRTTTADEIDEESQFFPPCMANLHQILRQTHRLSYESRYQYTLFLKDIGVSVDENILFWENEYKKPHEGSICTHDWEDKEKKYKYQIQHAYGLLGSQGVKASHACDKFTDTLLSKMDGGCPFQHLSAKDLEKAIPKKIMKLPDVEDIFKFKDSGLPQKACTVYLKCQQKVLSKHRWNFSVDDISPRNMLYVTSPLHYYNIARRLCRKDERM